MTLAMFGCSLVLVACFFAWIPGRTMWCTALGAGTLYGYLLHGFLAKGSRFWNWYDARLDAHAAGARRRHAHRGQRHHGAVHTTRAADLPVRGRAGDRVGVPADQDHGRGTDRGCLIGERLGTGHTQIAQGGACLVATDGCVGLEQQFGRPDPNAATPDGDFSRYRANAVVINLGTNDVGHGVSSTQFQSAYSSLLRKVRAAYPQAWIVAPARRRSGRRRAGAAVRGGPTTMPRDSTIQED